jgi:phage shock protein PspC (stress-responsive transcriptional regulator)
MEEESTKEDTMATNDQSPRHEAAFYTSIRGWGLTRGEHGVVGGVIEGVGDKIGLDRTPARIIAVVLLFMTQGFFFALYAAAWALLPDRSGRIILQDFGRGTPNVGALIVIAIFAMIGLGSGPSSWSDDGTWGVFSFGGLWPLIPLGIAAAAIALIVILVARHNDGPGASDTAAPSSPRGATAVPPERGAYAVPSQRRAAAAGPASASTATSATAAGAAAVTSEGAAGAAPPATPPTSPLPPVPPRPRTPGPGSAIYLLTLSTAVFAAAAIWFLEREGELAASPVVAWFAVAVVVIGGAIILTGALGRRVGFLGFLATTFIVGWLIGLAVVPRALDFAEGGVTITIDGVRHTIGDDRGWFDDSAGGIDCGPYDLTESEFTGATRYVVEPGQESVTVSSPIAVVVVPRDTSLSFASDGIVSGSLSIDSRDVTCFLERAQGSLYSILRTGDTVTVNIDTPHAIIAIEEN